MICVAIKEKNPQKIKSLLFDLQMAEIRIDMAELSKETVTEIFSTSTIPLIATCRPEFMSDAYRMELLKTAILSGAKYVDIEIESESAFTAEMVDFALANNCRVIVSYHNFELTPSDIELQKIVDTCFALGADIAKLATMVLSKEDNIRLFQLYRNQKPVIALGMGEEGKISRLAATVLGAPFTFAAIDVESATAPGQFEYSELSEILEKFD